MQKYYVTTPDELTSLLRAANSFEAEDFSDLAWECWLEDHLEDYADEKAEEDRQCRADIEAENKRMQDIDTPQVGKHQIDVIFELGGLPFRR